MFVCKCTIDIIPRIRTFTAYNTLTLFFSFFLLLNNLLVIWSCKENVGLLNGAALDNSLRVYFSSYCHCLHTFSTDVVWYNIAPFIKLVRSKLFIRIIRIATIFGSMFTGENCYSEFFELYCE